jgi:hypothetical protein
MANGLKQLWIASPQPGTTNTPFAAGPIPPFVPVAINCTDENAAAMIEKTAELETELIVLQAFLFLFDSDLLAMVKETGTIADQLQVLSKTLSATPIALYGKASAQSHSNTLLATSASNQVQTNNYFLAANKDKPVMPPTTTQLKDVMIQGSALKSALFVASATQDYLTTGISAISNWIKGTGPYKTAVKWLEDAVDSIVNLVPPSVRSVFTSTSAAAGTKVP